MAEKQDVCGYSYDEKRMRLRINCLGCLYGASIEDYDECMARVIDKILETKKVATIVLAKEREYEYDYEQTKMLVEIARVIENIIRERLISFRGFDERCRRYYPEWSSKVQYIVFDLMRRDPIGSYVETIREIRHVNIRMKKTMSSEEYECLHAYKKNILERIKTMLESTRLIDSVKDRVSGYHIGDRSLYREFFMPSVRPNFMLTRYIITPPEHGRPVDRYRIGDIDVEIFRVPETTEYIYHVIPPEFKLSEEKYTILDAARRYMASQRPASAEFVKSKKTREIFFNIGKDMIREVASQMGAELTVEELEQLATILTRYTAGLGVLEILLADEKVQDIYINSPIERQPILINHQDWEECRTNLIPTMEDAEAWATRLRIESGRPLDEANPVLDTDLT
ncbi:MAG TPA: hypothetical protein ENG00_01295, partial [Candidatus Aenigmarchaeota archaeon]|nr:hypothetical protein [Candidatus Aenigmarchaeota archaeon]